MNNTYLSPLRRRASSAGVGRGWSVGRGLLLLFLLLTTALHADNTVGGDDMPWDNDDPITGDINADGVVNILDLTALIKLLNDQQQTGKATTNTSADVNCDGKVTVDDVTALRQIILSPTPTDE